MRNKKPYDALRRKIAAKFGTMNNFAKAIGLSLTTISNKLNDKTPWRVGDITRCCELLDISKEDISIYFLQQDL